MDQLAGGDVREVVQDFYARVSQSGDQACVCSTTYRPEDLAGLPEEVTSRSFGCGNPAAFDGLRTGDTVVDIGSGVGLDCLIAARKVGAAGRVIGLDMTDEMLSQAWENAARAGAANVSFHKGHAEQIPLPSDLADVVISNCVINLSPDKPAVFGEIGRVLKPGGRMIVADIVASADVPERLRRDAELWSQCLAGALREDRYLQAIGEGGLERATVLERRPWTTVEGIDFYAVVVRAEKPTA
ncbi:MAG: methyltransferase domain-containing protein [Armatimonadota bacterium]